MEHTLDFSWKYKDYELRTTTHGPPKTYRTMELVKWLDRKDVNNQKYCITLASFIKGNESYHLQAVGPRPFTDIEKEDVLLCWEMLKVAQNILDDYLHFPDEI